MANVSTKPALSFRVEYRPMGASSSQFKQFGSSGSATKFATGQIMHGSTLVQVHQHDSANWVLNSEATNLAQQKARGNGNPQAQAELVQLQEYNLLLAKTVEKRYPEADLVMTWLEQFYATAKSMGIMTGALQTAMLKSYPIEKPATPPQPQPQESKR